MRKLPDVLESPFAEQTARACQLKRIQASLTQIQTRLEQSRLELEVQIVTVQDLITDLEAAEDERVPRARSARLRGRAADHPPRRA